MKHKGLVTVNKIKEGDRFEDYAVESVRETKTRYIIQARFLPTGKVRELRFKQGQSIFIS